MIRRELVVNLLLALVSVLVLAVAVELALRVVGYDPMGEFLDREMGIDSVALLRVSQDPVLRYELSPNARGYAFQTQIETNSHGFRDREWAPSRGDAYRVVVLGDSVAFGNYLNAEDRFSDLLHDSLGDELATPVEVMNLAVVGYDTLQEVVTLERRGLMLSPDLVLLTYCVNDLGVVSFNERYLRDAPFVSSRIYRLRLAQFLRNKLDQLREIIRLKAANEERQFAADNARHIVAVHHDVTLIELVEQLESHLGAAQESGRFRSPPRNDPVIGWYTSLSRLGKLDYSLQRLARLKQAHGFEVAVVLVPYLNPSEAYRVAYRIVEHEARKHGLDLISLESEFDDHGIAALRISHRSGDKTHPNERGHRLIADKLRDYVARRARQRGAGLGGS